MQMPEGCRFAYVISHEAWYHDVIDRPTINVAASAEGGGVAWEFSAEEVDLGREIPSIRVKVFDDAFAAFQQIPEFFAALGEVQPTTLAGIVKLLDQVGAVDETQRVRPSHV